MNDFDVLVGSLDFAKHTEDRLFAEYEPDPVRNKNNPIRQFGTIALFDRKSHWGACSLNIATKYQLHICRALSELQPVPVRFFWVVEIELDHFGFLGGGYAMQEVSTTTGERLECRTLPLDGSLWSKIWEEVGLYGNRTRLREWLRSTSPEQFRAERQKSLFT
tara:strand:+ start:779 stop:1267 length:489 start_codon:yes stop_codon:yes gene_type:complete